MKTTYHGWIYINKTEGFNDHFEAVHYGSEGGDYKTVDCGYGATGAAKAVDFFETDGGLGLGPIKLLPTPLGLRVYTEQEEVGDVYEVHIPDNWVALTYLQQFVKSWGALSEYWQNCSMVESEQLNEFYPKGWKEFTELYSEAIEWLTATELKK